MKLQGKTWKFGNDINTDLLLPVPVVLMPTEEQSKHVMEANRPGWVQQVRPGEIIVAGRNFGMGSGRPAARAVKGTGITCVLAESINGLYFRNSVNFGLWAMEVPGVHDAFEEGDVAEVDFEAFTVRNARSGKVLKGQPFPKSLRDIIVAGGVIPMLDSQGLLLPKLPPRGAAPRAAAR
jgi:3-isopropylmalate/(R)-2-methylmalate dehydratase small subunit